MVLQTTIDTITHAIGLAVAPVFLLTAIGLISGQLLELLLLPALVVLWSRMKLRHPLLRI